VRTFLNPVAGVLEMPARQFFVYNLIGGVLWTDGIVLIGYFVSKQITKLIPADKIDTYLVPVVILIALISALPISSRCFRGWREKKRGGARLPSRRRTSTPTSPGTARSSKLAYEKATFADLRERRSSRSSSESGGAHPEQRLEEDRLDLLRTGQREEPAADDVRDGLQVGRISRQPR